MCSCAFVDKKKKRAVPSVLNTLYSYFDFEKDNISWFGPLLASCLNLFSNTNQWQTDSRTSSPFTNFPIARKALCIHCSVQDIETHIYQRQLSSFFKWKAWTLDTKRSRSDHSKMPSTIGDKTYSKSIELPETEVFRNLKNAKRFAMDIGMMFLFKRHW